MLLTSELDYDLPPERIATRPAEPRESARLLVVSRSDPARMEDRTIRDLPGLLTPGDLLVFNTTRVVPARLGGRRADTGGAVGGLYLRDAGRGGGAATGERSTDLWWEALLQGKRLRPGLQIRLHDAEDRPTPFFLALATRLPDEPGGWLVRVTDEGEPLGLNPATRAVLERVGATPLPPYIVKARRVAGEAPDEALDRARYQTVYADEQRPGSVAAPTAGLHFTPGLLGALAARGVGRADVTLHVGTGTFKPISVPVVEDHRMHAEWCSLGVGTRAAVDRVRRSRAEGGMAGRVIAVGTTSARTLETFGAAAEVQERGRDGEALPEWLETRLLVTPGYRWRWTDGLLTNFHLPRSTLLAMVAALFPGEPGGAGAGTGTGRGGIERARAIYAHAVARRYRFYSFGDAMLVLP